MTGCVAAILLATSTMDAVKYYYGDYPPILKEGILAAARYSRFSHERLTTAYELNTGVSYEERPFCVSVPEYEAYIWLRDNTEEDAIIADSRYLTCNTFFNGTSFSERSFYLEGTRFVTMDDTNDNTEEKLRRESTLHFLYDYLDDSMCVLLANEGCDYIIINDYVTPDFSVRGKYGTLVFENEDVKIYKLVKFD